MAKAAFTPGGHVIAERAKTPPPKKVRLTQTGTRRDTDITLDPDIVRSMRRYMASDDISQGDLVSASLRRLFAKLVEQPGFIQVQATHCPTCLRQFKYARSRGGKKRIRLSVVLTDADLQALTWIADRYYHGTYSRALEAAVVHYLPEEVLPPNAKVTRL